MLYAFTKKYNYETKNYLKMEEMIMKKLTAAALTGLLVLGTFGTTAFADEDTTITVAASTTPHAEILAQAKPLLEELGYDLEVTEFDDYVLPNEVVESGEFDANYFQHIPYLNSFNEEKGTHLVDAGDIHYEPFGIYPGTKDSLDALEDGDSIAIPNDTTNEARALLLLQDNGIKINALCQLTPAQWEDCRKFITDETIAKRARHCVYENQRVLDAVEALKSGDLAKLGSLLNQSHKSLDEDYEVTGIELNTLASASQKQEGCLGARMTGAGFGGCAIALVHKDKVDSFIENVQKEYTRVIGYAAGFFACESGNGVARFN